MRQTDRKLGALEQTRVNGIHSALLLHVLHVHCACAILEVSELVKLHSVKVKVKVLARMLGMNIASARGVSCPITQRPSNSGVLFSPTLRNRPRAWLGRAGSLSRRSFALDLTWRRRLLLKVSRPRRLGLANGEAQLSLTEASRCFP